MWYEQQKKETEVDRDDYVCNATPGCSRPLEKKKSGGRVQTLISQNKFKFLNFTPWSPHSLPLVYECVRKGEDDDQVPTITYSVDMNLSKRSERVEDRGPWHAAVHGAAKSQTQLSNSTATRKGEGTWPFLPCHHFQPKLLDEQLTQIRRDLRGFFGGQCFFNGRALFLSLEQILVLMESVASWGCQLPCWLCNRLKKITLDSFWVSLTSRVLWVPGNCVLIGEQCVQRGRQRMVLCSSCPCVPVPSNATHKTQTQRENYQEFQEGCHGAFNQAWGPSAHGALWDCRGCPPVMLFLTTTVHSIVVKGGCRTKFNGRSYKLPLKPNMLDS